MINKKFIILAIFLVSLLAVSAVSAADNTTGDIVGVEETTDEVVSVDENQVFLKENNNVGTFTDLANEIANATNELNLTRNYTYDVGDYDYEDAIIIDKSITINGNGFTINGNNQARIFNIALSNVVINNIHFINFYHYDNGAAIQWNGLNGTLCNCSFEKLSFSPYCGAISWFAANGSIRDCSFKCSSTYDETVKCYGYNNVISNCIFEDCGCEGGTISLQGDNSILANSKFVKCSAYSGATVNWGGANGILINCTFANSSINSYDGFIGGCVVNWYGANGTLSSCNIEDCSATRSGCGAIYWSGDKGVLGNCSFVNCSVSSSSSYDGSSVGGAVYWYGADGFLVNCSFVNCSIIINNVYYNLHGGGAVYWFSVNGVLANCSFVNCSTLGKDTHGGAVYWYGSGGNLFNCIFKGNSAGRYGGAMYGDCSAVNCTFINNFALESGGAMCYSVSAVNCTFINNTAETGGAMFACHSAVNCTFINNFALESGGAMYIDRFAGSTYDSRSAVNCTFINNTAEWGGGIYVGNKYGKVHVSIIYCCFSQDTGNIYPKDSDIEIIKRDTNIQSNSISFLYLQSSEFPILLKGDKILINKTVFFKLNNGYIIKTFYKTTNNNGFASLTDELNELTVGIWQIISIFEGNDNYNPCNATATITVLPASSSLTIEDANTTVGHEINLVANVNSNLTVNEGVVTFFDGETEITESSVSNGVATLSYTPSTDGEHIITAIFNSDNYYSSNDTAKLLVDSATVELLADTGTVGFESNFVANVKGLYSTINEGNVYFYIDDEYIGIDKVVDGVATLTYTPLIAGKYTVKGIYSDSIHFLDAENNTYYTVDKANSQTIINNVNGTVGHELTITADIFSSNNLTINDGSVIFYDDGICIGESDVYNAIATLNYAPTTAGEHTISAIYNSNNYQSSNSSALLTVAKADVDLSIDYIADVYFTEQSRFTVNVNSNSKAVSEGEIKYYVNDVLVGSSDVYNGVSSFSYVAKSVGFSVLKVVYEGTDNYFSSDATSVFTVNKMLTSLSGETAFFDEDQSKIYTTTLTDVNGHGVYNQKTKIEVIKYSGESRTFQSRSDSEGVTSYDINTLAGGMWIVRGIFEENDNYIGSTFTDRFIVIRMDTTTAIEEIVNPRVNHTYKLKANIHDENGKLVKEGIVQFYLDGVDIGSIDLSENQGHQNALRSGLLGAGEDDEPYLEYTPTKAGNFTLSAVYEGTTVYKSSNSATEFFVLAEGKNATKIVASDVTTVYNGGGELIATLINDDTGKSISGASIIVNINNADYTLKTNSQGEVRLSTDGLAPNTYTATITYKGNSKYGPSSTTVNVVVNKADTIISAVYNNAASEIVATLTNANNGKAISSANVKFNINGKTTTVKTNSKGQAKFSTVGLSSGTVSISYAGNSKYNAASTSITFDTKMDTSISAVYDAVNSEIVATLTNAEGKALSSANVKVTFNGETKTLKTNTKGQVKVSAADLPLGTYPATFSYAGNSKYNAASTSINVEVKTKVIVTDVYAYSDRIVAKLTNGATGKFIANANMIVEINGVKYNAKSDNKGQLTFDTTGLDLPSAYDLTISYRGNDRYTASSATVAVDLNKANMMITTNYHADKQKMVATLKNSKTGKVVSNANMIIDLNGVKTTYKSNDQGKITLPTVDFAPGTYVGTVTYPGNARYNSISAAFKIDI